MRYTPEYSDNEVANYLDKLSPTMAKGSAHIEIDGQWSDDLLYIKKDFYYILSMETEWFINRYTGSVYKKKRNGKKRTEYTCEKIDTTPKW